MTINDNKFSYIVNLTNKNSTNIVVSKNELKFVNEKNSDINSKIQNLLTFLSDHNELTPERLKKIQKKFSHEIQTHPELKDKIEQTFKKLSKPPATTSTSEPVRIQVQLASPPQSLEEWQANLALIADKFPKYQLGNDLAIYDTTYLSSDEFDAELIRNKLKEKKEELSKEKNDPLKTDQIENLVNSIDYALSLLKPHQVVHLYVAIEEGLEGNRALLSGCESAIAAGKHLCITKQLIRSHPREFDALFKNSDIYVQARGNLMLVVPKGTQPRDYGYVNPPDDQLAGKKDFLKLWTEEPSDIYASSTHPLELHDDLRNLLADDTEEQGYARFVILHGHGGGGNIAGVFMGNFPNLMQVLSDKKTLSAGICTCFIGNETFTSKITTSSNKVPFPVLFQGTSDLVTYTGFPLIKVLEDIQEKVLGNKDSTINKRPLHIRPLQRKDTQKILKNIFSKEPIVLTVTDGANLPSLMLPTDKDIPRTAASISFRKNIVDLSTEIPQEPTTEVSKWKDPSYAFEALYAFSKPVLNLELTSNSHPIFISRGTNSHHLMDKLICNYSDLRTLTEKTLNLMMDANVNKTFTIRELEDQKGVMENVVIHYSPKECFVIFKKPGENFYHKWEFQKSKYANDQWKFLYDKQMTSLDAEVDIFAALSQSQPSKTLLEISTAGQFTDQQFFDTFCDSFWKSASPEVKLFEALASKEIYQQKVFDKNRPNQVFTRFELALEEVSKIPDEEKRNEILFEALVLARKVHYGEAAIQNASKNPLMKAVENSKYGEVFDLIKSHPEYLNEKDCNGKTVLNMVLEGKNKLTMLAMFYDPAIWQGEAGYRALSYAIENFHKPPNEEVARELISRKAGVKFTSDSLISLAILEEQDKAVELFLKEPHIDLNVHNYKIGKEKKMEDLPPLHAAIYLAIKKDEDESFNWIQKMLIKGADPSMIGGKGLDALMFALSFSERKEENILKVIKLLLPYVKVMTWENEKGETALKLAQKGNFDETIKVLEEASRNSLMKAIESEDLQLIVEILKNNPEQAKQKTFTGKTPLNMVLEKNDSQITQIFEQNFQLDDETFNQALDYSLKNLHEVSNIFIAQHLIQKLMQNQSNTAPSPTVEKEREKAEEFLNQLKPYDRKTLPPFHIAMYMILKHGDPKSLKYVDYTGNTQTDKTGTNALILALNLPRKTEEDLNRIINLLFPYIKDINLLDKESRNIRLLTKLIFSDILEDKLLSSS